MSTKKKTDTEEVLIDEQTPETVTPETPMLTHEQAINQFAEKRDPVWVVGTGNIERGMLKGEAKRVLPEIAALLIANGEAVYKDN